MTTTARAFIIFSCATCLAVCAARAQSPARSGASPQDTFAPARPAFTGSPAAAAAASSAPQPAATGSETDEVTVNGRRPISVREGARFYIETLIPDAMEVNMAIASGRVCADESLPIPKRLASCDMAIWKLRGTSMEGKELATIYVARAGARQQSGNDPAAIEDYKAAGKLDPSSPRPWLGLGNLYVARADYSQALASYNVAVAIAPDDPIVFDNRGAALERLGHHDEALAAFSRAIRLDPKDLSAYSNRATVYRTSQREELAIADLTEVIRADPSSGQAFYDRGTAYELSGNLERAKADYRETVRRMPSFAPATAALGRLDSKDDPQLALAEFGAAIRLDPKSPALRARALLYLSLEQPERALPDLDRVIANDASDAIAWANRGVAKSRLGDMEGAIADCTHAIELAPSVLNRVNRGNAYATLHRDAEALADFDMALQTDPLNLPALLGHANANYASRRLAASLADYTRVIALDPHNALYFFKRGNIHLDLKEFGAALSDYSESLKIDPNQAVVLLNRSIAAARLGHRHDAAMDQERAFALDPNILDGGPETHSR